MGEKTNDALKLEIAEELGLLDKVNSGGWKSLSAKESGRIGGILARRKKAASVAAEK
ncbi:MAG: alpha/beta-type small acid-soluble spore protein [Defluviitaleaceae bacterium]|nr:alpha/beta-type small acid-soluble spore protein [Defluviitaleaceae bacterium]